MAILLAVGGLGIYLLSSASGDAIAQGVTVAGVSIGGESIDSATALLQQAFAARTVRLTDGDRSWSVPLSTLGVSLDMPLVMQVAENASAGTDIPAYYTVDLNVTQSGLFALSDQVNIAPEEGNPPRTGRAMDVPVLLDRLRVSASGELADGILDLNMFEVEPPETETVNHYTGQTSVHVVQAGEELGLIAKQYGVAVDDILAMNDIGNPDLLYVGQELTIPAAGIYEPTQAEAPQAPTSVGKSIVVSTDAQRIYAYENGQLVHSHLVSTGLPDTPTVKGDYSVYVKYEATDMSGPGYYLPQVPYTMYFYQGYGIHGTYWHNNFGRPMSHGCVNLPTPEAQWFFNWAEVGTPVRVI